MKRTIFRLTYAGLLIAAFLACGAVASFAQDPCTDVAGLNAKQDEYDKLWAGRNDTDAAKALANRKAAVNSGKEFIDKFGACDAAKERTDWLKVQLPKQEATIKQMEAGMETGAVLKPFNAALQASGATDAAAKARAYDDIYNYGGQILTKWPENYRTTEIVLATIGGDEALIRNNYKYADQSLRYAKMAIADLEANKSFAVEGKGSELFGLSMYDANKKAIYDYSFKDRNAALGWMNLYVGNILTHNGDKAGALPYLYKATKLVPDSPAAYAMIGTYYFDQLAPAIKEINDMIADVQKDTNVDSIKTKNEAIKAKVAMSNGIAERAMDAYARAYTISTKADYKTSMKNTIDQVFKVRYGTTPPMSEDQWIASTVTKPFVDPTTPVQPVADPEPVKTTSGETTTTTTAPAKTQAPAKPATTTTAKKPGVAGVKSKTAAKKRAA